MTTEWATPARLEANRANAKLANAANAAKALRRYRMVLSAVEDGAGNSDLAKWFGISEPAAANLKTRALRTVEAADGTEHGARRNLRADRRRAPYERER